MKVSVRTLDDGEACLLTVEGEVDVTTAPRLRTELSSRIERGCTHVIIDLEKVGFIDSSGLGVLVGALRRAREKNGDLRIVCTKDVILNLFRITGLDKAFTIFADLRKAKRF